MNENEYFEEKYATNVFGASVQKSFKGSVEFLNPLLTSAKNDEDVNVQSLAFLVHFKRQKWVLATNSGKMAKRAEESADASMLVESLSRGGVD